MNINKFAIVVSKLEGKKKQLTIAQIKEVLKVVNTITAGAFYRLIHKS